MLLFCNRGMKEYRLQDTPAWFTTHLQAVPTIGLLTANPFTRLTCYTPIPLISATQQLHRTWELLSDP